MTTHISQEDVEALSEALGLMNSMILCGEQHSPSSQAVFDKAKEVIHRIRPNQEAPVCADR
jgi:hypothetical protein